MSLERDTAEERNGCSWTRQGDDRLAVKAEVDRSEVETEPVPQKRLQLSPLAVNGWLI